MNDQNIQEVLKIEKQAQEMQDKSRREAQELPARAEQEGLALIAKAKADAQEEARKIIAAAQIADGTKNMAKEADAKASQDDTLAKKNFDKAVAYVLERVIGRA